MENVKEYPLEPRIVETYLYLESNRSLDPKLFKSLNGYLDLFDKRCEFQERIGYISESNSYILNRDSFRKRTILLKKACTQFQTQGPTQREKNVPIWKTVVGYISDGVKDLEEAVFGNLYK